MRTEVEQTERILFARERTDETCVAIVVEAFVCRWLGQWVINIVPQSFHVRIELRLERADRLRFFHFQQFDLVVHQLHRQELHQHHVVLLVRRSFHLVSGLRVDWPSALPLRMLLLNEFANQVTIHLPMAFEIHVPLGGTGREFHAWGIVREIIVSGTAATLGWVLRCNCCEERWKNNFFRFLLKFLKFFKFCFGFKNFKN